MSRLLLTLLFGGLLLAVTSAFAADDEPQQPHFYRRNAQAIQATYDRQIEKETAAIEKSPDDIRNYSNRGNAYFFNGHFDKAVADYEKMSQLNPKLNVSHWRLGLAYHFAGRFEDASKQLALYGQYDDRDRENGIWIFLSDAKAAGIDKAREKMIRYTVKDRPPLTEIYHMYEGKLTGDQLQELVNEQIKSEKLGTRDKEQRQFYAHIYIGFLADLENNRDLARKSFVAATEYIWPIKAGSGPEYMWHSARLKLMEYDREQEAEKAKQNKPDK